MRKKISLLILVLLTLLGACNGESITNAPILTEQPGIETEPVQSTNTIEPTTTSIPTLEATRIPYSTPSWFHNSVVYEIFVRSFADSDGNGIGDFRGITENLYYLDSLSVDVIWLMPIYPSPSVHGYDVTDYFSVNPDYGTMTDFVDLVNGVHERGMHIILDFVPSHLSNRHPLFEDAYNNPNSDISEWFVWTNESHTRYAGFANSEAMPRFNHYNEEVVQYLINAAIFWLDLDNDGEYSDGVDGFRVDNATFPPQEFFITLRQCIKYADSDTLLLGEAWVHSVSDMGRFFLDQFDALFDFPFYELMQGNRDFNGDGLLAGDGFPVLLTTLLSDEEKYFPPESIPVRFFSNHDTNRVYTELGGSQDQMRLSTSLLAALPNSVMLYYGEEIGMPGQKGGPPHWDNYRREPMDWYEVESGYGMTNWFKPADRWNKPSDGISVEEQEGDPSSLLTYYRLVFDLRSNMPAIRDGEYQTLEIEASGFGPWGFQRFIDDHFVLAIFNFSSEEREATITEFPFSSNSVVDVISGQEFSSAKKGEPFTVTLSPAESYWLVGK